MDYSPNHFIRMPRGRNYAQLVASLSEPARRLLANLSGANTAAVQDELAMASAETPDVIDELCDADILRRSDAEDGTLRLLFCESYPQATAAARKYYQSKRLAALGILPN